MDLSTLASYGASGTANINSARERPTTEKSSGGLTTTDFLRLLAAQFSHQDITNPTDNTQFISELAQFTSLQAMNTLTAYADHQYAASLVGKTVQVQSYDTAGKKVLKTGVVSYANFSPSDGSSSIVVDQQAYDLSSVLQVLADASAADPGDGDKKDDPGTKPSGGDSGGTDPVGGDNPGTGDGSSGK